MNNKIVAALQQMEPMFAIIKSQSIQLEAHDLDVGDIVFVTMIIETVDGLMIAISTETDLKNQYQNKNRIEVHPIEFFELINCATYDEIKSLDQCFQRSN